MGLITVKGLSLHDSPTGAGGIALSDNFTELGNRAPTYHEATSNPGVTNDGVDTAALGTAFYKRSIWLNTNTNAIYVCAANTTGAAVWQQINNTDKITFALAGVQTVGTDKTNHLPVEYACKIIAARIIAKTAPTGQALIVDIKLNGTTIQSGTKLQLADGATSGVSTTFSTTAVSVGDYFSIDVTQVGSGVAGSDVTVLLTIRNT